MKVGMDSIMASYFALFEVINHSFGKNFVCIRCLRVFQSEIQRMFLHTLVLLLTSSPELRAVLSHPTVEFSPFSQGVCVQFWTARAGNLVQAKSF